MISIPLEVGAVEQGISDKPASVPWPGRRRPSRVHAWPTGVRRGKGPARSLLEQRCRAPRSRAKQSVQQRIWGSMYTALSGRWIARSSTG